MPTPRDTPRISVTISKSSLDFLDGAWAALGKNPTRTRSRRVDLLIQYVKKQYEAQVNGVKP